MTIELPEAAILARQMHDQLRGRTVRACRVRDLERLQRLDLVDRDTGGFDRLAGGAVERVEARGKVIRIAFDTGRSLLIGPEYGARVLFHETIGDVPAKHHLVLEFADRTALSIRLTGMGHLHADTDDRLESRYIYRRDFSDVLAPTDPALTAERLSELLAERSQMLKSVLVGKDAVVVGLSNTAFQDVAYRAGLHPKRKAADLDEGERKALYGAIQDVIGERHRLGGIDDFVDLRGRPGDYLPAMGPHLDGAPCPRCGTSIDTLRVGGGRVCYCPGCQK